MNPPTEPTLNGQKPSKKKFFLLLLSSIVGLLILILAGSVISFYAYANTDVTEAFTNFHEKLSDNALLSCLTSSLQTGKASVEGDNTDWNLYWDAESEELALFLNLETSDYSGTIGFYNQPNNLILETDLVSGYYGISKQTALADFQKSIFYPTSGSLLALTLEDEALQSLESALEALSQEPNFFFLPDTLEMLPQWEEIFQKEIQKEGDCSTSLSFSPFSRKTTIYLDEAASQNLLSAIFQGEASEEYVQKYPEIIDFFSLADWTLSMELYNSFGSRELVGLNVTLTYQGEEGKSGNLTFSYLPKGGSCQILFTDQEDSYTVSLDCGKNLSNAQVLFSKNEESVWALSLSDSQFQLISYLEEEPTNLEGQISIEDDSISCTFLSDQPITDLELVGEIKITLSAQETIPAAPCRYTDLFSLNELQFGMILLSLAGKLGVDLDLGNLIGNLFG
jgi:hypothetical protein